MWKTWLVSRSGNGIHGGVNPHLCKRLQDGKQSTKQPTGTGYPQWKDADFRINLGFPGHDVLSRHGVAMLEQGQPRFLVVVLWFAREQQGNPVYTTLINIVQPPNNASINVGKFWGIPVYLYLNGCGYLVQIKIQDPGKALVLGQGYAKICPNVQVYPEWNNRNTQYFIAKIKKRKRCFPIDRFFESDIYGFLWIIAE